MNPLISMVADARSTACRDARAVAVLEGVRGGRWREPVEAIRAEYQRAAAAGLDAKEAVSGMKRAAPGVLWAGRFERRRGDSLIAHSGLLVLDLDGLTADRIAAAREKLTASAHVAALFLSPTGTGLKVLLKVPADPARHAASFSAGAALVRELTGVEADPSGKDVARLCFVSYDPDAYANWDAITLQTQAEVPQGGLAVPAPARLDNGSLPPSVAALLASGAAAGERNERALWLACQLRDCGRSQAEVEQLLQEYGARCTPPLASDDELRELAATVRSAFSRTAREPARAPGRAVAAVTAGPAPDAAATTSASGDEAVFARLAAMPPADYDRVREGEAEAMGIRVSTLDAEVAKRRPAADPGGQGAIVAFEDNKPAAEPVNGAELFGELVGTVEQHVALPDGAAGYMALWAVHTHALDIFDYSPILQFTSSVHESGKTIAADVVLGLSRRGKHLDDVSAPFVFRIITRFAPTLVLDEVDKQAEELRLAFAAILNSGFRRGGAVGRCVGDDQEPREFPTFCPKIVAGLCDLRPDTASRTMRVRMERTRRRMPDFSFEAFSKRVAPLRSKIVRWVQDNRLAIRDAKPGRPDWMGSRQWDITRPLACLARVLAPGLEAELFEWVKLLSQERTEQSVGLELLSDIKGIFTAQKADRISSAHLAELLAELEGRPWGDWRHGKPLTPSQLARLLRKFSTTADSFTPIGPRTYNTGEKVPGADNYKYVKGYFAADFQYACDTYLSSRPPQTSRNAVTTPANKGESALLEPSHRGSRYGSENSSFANKHAGCDGVTAQSGGVGGKGCILGLLVGGQAVEVVGAWADGSPLTGPLPGDVQPVEEDGQRVQSFDPTPEEAAQLFLDSPTVTESEAQEVTRA